jgi:capsular polysaccharide biosynthesis protein
MDTAENEIELIDLLNIIWKRKWLILIPAFFCVVIAAVVSFRLPKVWEVDAIMLPSKFFVQTEQGQFEEVVVTDPKQIAGQINQESYNSLIASQLNLDIRKFPKPKAENIRDTKLVRIAVRDRDIAKAKSILQALFNLLKKELDKRIDVEMKTINTDISLKENSKKENDIGIKDLGNQIELKKLQIKDEDNAIKTKENEIKKRNNDIKIKNLEAQSKEIEKERIKKEIETDQNKLKISEERVESIMEEMKSVKQRIDKIEEQLTKTIAEKKQGGDAVSLLLYSNEIQQNLRYYNTLDEKLSTEKITQENLRLSIRDKQQQLLQIDNQINQINTMVDSIKAEIDNIMTEISVVKTRIQKIGNEIETVKNEIDKIKNANNKLQSEITLLGDKKARIDYAQLVKEPTSSLYPVSPRKKRNVLIAGMLGAFAFTMLAFLLEYVEKQKLKNNKKPGVKKT